MHGNLCSGAIDYNEFVAWTQGGRKTLAKKKQASLVPDLQAALERSQSEAAAVASIPFDAVMAVTYTGACTILSCILVILTALSRVAGEIKQFDKSGGTLEAMGVRTPHNQRLLRARSNIVQTCRTAGQCQLLLCFSWLTYRLSESQGYTSVEDAALLLAQSRSCLLYLIRRCRCFRISSIWRK